MMDSRWMNYIGVSENEKMQDVSESCIFYLFLIFLVVQEVCLLFLQQVYLLNPTLFECNHIAELLK